VVRQLVGQGEAGLRQALDKAQSPPASCSSWTTSRWRFFRRRCHGIAAVMRGGTAPLLSESKASTDRAEGTCMPPGSGATATRAIGAGADAVSAS
jgi:hypothetical protein